MYIYSSTLLEYNFDVLVLEYVHFLLIYTPTLLHFRGKYSAFTQLRVSDHLSDFVDCSL